MGSNPRVPGVNQPANTTRRFVVSLTSQLVGREGVGTIRLPWPARAFRFVVSSGVAAGDVFVAMGSPDEVAAAGGGAALNVASLRDVFDPSLVAVVQLRSAAVNDLIVYTRAALVGETLTVFAFKDAEILPPSGGAVSISGTADVNLAELGGSTAFTALAGLPALRVAPYGSAGMTVATADADHFYVTAVGSANTLLRAGQTDGYLFDGLAVVTNIPSYVALRRNNTNAARGIMCPYYGTARPAPPVYAGGTSLYAANPSGADQDVIGFLYRAFA